MLTLPADASAKKALHSFSYIMGLPAKPAGEADVLRVARRI